MADNVNRDNISIDDQGRTSYVLMLVNPDIRKAVAPIIKEVDWGPELEEFIEVAYSMDGPIPDSLIRMIFRGVGFPEQQIRFYLKLADDYRNISGISQLSFMVEKLRSYLLKEVTLKTIQDYVDGLNDNERLQEFYDKISDLKNISIGYLPTEDLENLDPSKVILDELGQMESIPSFLDHINQSLPLGGYLRGSVVMVMAGPSRGKTTYLFNEAAHAAMNGYKVLFLALGDMMRTDFLVKLVSIVKEIPSSEVFRKFQENDYSDWNSPEVQAVAENIDILVVPAGVVTASDIYGEADQNDYDVVVVDYDANIRGSSSSMYEKHGEVYNEMMKVARPRNGKYRLVLIGSQTKPYYWGSPLVPLEAAAESSQKQHVSDVIITIGRDPHASRHIGFINIVKSRRGFTNDEVRYVSYLLDKFGKMRQIPISDYRNWGGTGP